MVWHDRYGNLLQYGDYIEDLDKRYIGKIVRGSITDKPVLYVIKKFSYRDMEYKELGNSAANPCYERDFISEQGLHRIFHRSWLPNIELIQHGERNRRMKEF